jgi:hypothetical protein
MALLTPIMAAGTLGLFWYEQQANGLGYARTVGFTTMAAFQWFQALNARSEHESVLSIGLFSNRWILWGVGAAVLLQVVVVHTAVGHLIFGTVDLAWADWLWILVDNLVWNALQHAYAGTVVLMPFMVPWLAKGFTADSWAIAKPLVFFIATPLVVGAAICRVNETVAEKAAPVVKKVTGLATLILCAVLLWVYRGEIFSAVGTYAIGTQILCYALLGVGSYLLAFGLTYDQKAPMVLGTCTRNVGPALATLFGVAGAPQGAITMCILAIFLGAILSGFAAAAVLKRFCAPAGGPADAPEGAPRNPAG